MISGDGDREEWKAHLVGLVLDGQFDDGIKTQATFRFCLESWNLLFGLKIVEIKIPLTAQISVKMLALLPRSGAKS